MGIRIDPKYGLNPSMTQCIICGEDDAIILGGRFKDRNGNPCEAPMRCGVVSVEPCPRCRKKYLEEAHGVLLVEAIGGEHSPQPTGSICIITAEAFGRIFTIPIPAKRICFIEPPAFALFQSKKEEAPK